jgi:transposase
MSEDRVWIGFDLGLSVTHVCVIDDRGVTLHEQQSETKVEALEAALSSFSIEQIALIAVEAGSDTHVVRGLRANGFPIAIFEARKASKFLAVRRNKTDASDARGLADLARLGQETVSQVYLKSPECEQLRSVLTMRKRLVIMRVSGDNALRGRLMMHGLRLKASRCPGDLRNQVEKAIAELNPDQAENLRSEIGPLVDLCERLRAYITKITADLEKRARRHDVCRRLMEVPGVGPICALSFFSAIEDPDRFERPSDVAAYLGLVPRRYQSGQVSRTRGITKTGCKLTRTYLVNAAKTFGQIAPDGGLKQWYLALRDRAGWKRARIALARKLAVILATMWKNGTHFEVKPSPSRGESSHVSKDESAAAPSTRR